MVGHAPLGFWLKELPLLRRVRGFISEFVGDVEAVAAKACVVVVDVAASAKAEG